MNEILLLMKGLILAKLLVSFTPIREIMSLVPLTIFNSPNILLRKLDDLYVLILSIVKGIYDCFLCSSFWITLFITKDIYMAALSYYIAMWYNSYIQPYEVRLYLNTTSRVKKTR